MDRFILQSHRGESVPKKTVFLVRHGESLHNAQSLRWNGADYNSPLYIDSSLTSTGEEQARAISVKIREMNVDLIVTSPLTRAIQTMLLATRELNPKPAIVVNKLCCERLGASCDIGSASETLARRFPDLDFSELQPPDAWWWTATNYARRPTNATESLNLLTRSLRDRSIIGDEPSDSLLSRVSAFRTWLLSRPEKRIVVFAHGVFLYWLSEPSNSGNFYNCEIRKIVI